MAERSVSVKLSASVDSYVAAMGKAQASTAGFSASSQANLKKVGGQMQSVGGDLTRYVSVPLAAAAGVAIHSAAKFDTAFSQMVGLAGVAADEIDGLKQSVLDLAGKTAVAPQELADALYQAASSGLDTAAAMKAVEVAAVASAAGMGSAGDVVSLVASAVNSYGAANITAAEATDILTATIREGRADPEELAGSLGRVLPVAAAMGVSFEEVGGAVAYLSNIFGDTDRTVTAVNDAMAKLSAPTDGARDALEAAGTSAAELQSTIRDDGLLAGLELLRDHGFAGNAAAIRELMPDMQGAVALTALLNDESGTLTATLAGVADNTGAAGEAFDAVASGPGFAMKQAVTDLKVAFIQAGDVIMPIAAGVVGAVSDIASAFSDLPAPAQAVVLGFLAVVAAVGPLMTVGGKLVSNLKLIGTGFDKLKGASAGAQTAMGAVGIALGIATALYVSYNKRKSDATARTEEFVDALKAEADGQADATNSMIANALASDDMQRAMAALGLSTIDVARFIRGETVPAVDEAVGSIRNMEDAINEASGDAEAGELMIFADAVRGLGGSYVDAEAKVAAYDAAMVALAPTTDDATAATEASTAATEAAAVATEAAAAAADELAARAATHAAATDEWRLANEEAAARVEEHAEALSEQADAYVENFEAANTWMSEVAGAMDSAGGAISTFSDEALADIDTFQQELEDSITALYGWQNNLITIAAETSPEFATYLADMGLAGAGLVEDLAGNSPELEETFNKWKTASAVASRDMAAEFANVSPQAQTELETLGRDVASTIEGVGPLSKIQAEAVGAAIAAGMASGVDFNAQAVAAAALAAVAGAMADVQLRYGMHSPSRLFADKVGAPIAWGIAQGIDENQQKVIDSAQKLVEGFEKGIESAAKDALSAVDDMVDEVADRFDGMWDVVEGRRDMEDLVGRVADAELGLAEANQAATDAASEFGAGSAEHLAALSRVGDVTERLQDANYRLLQSSQALLDQGPAGQAAFIALAQAAGLEEMEIRNLILAYNDLQRIRATAIAERDQINAEAAEAQDVRARFGQAAASGLANEWIDHIAQFANDPAFQLVLMRQFLATLPSMDSGGVVPGSFGQPTPIMAHGGEVIGYPNMMAAGNSYGGNTAAVVVESGGIVLSGSDLTPRDVVEALSVYVRHNGPGALVKLTGG